MVGQFVGQFWDTVENCPKEKLFAEGDIWSLVGIQPRKWQAEALPIAVNAVRERQPSIVQAVMGAGKSKFIVGLVASAIRDGAKCVVVTTPRAALVKQLSQTLDEHLRPGMVGRYFGATKQPARHVVVACDASTEKLAASLAKLGRKVDLWVADECHGSEADRIHQWVDAVQPTARIGLTATPQRGKKTEGLTLWDKEIYRYDAAAAQRDGVVVPFEVIHWHGLPETPLDDAISEMIHEWRHLGPGIVDASNVDDATAFSQRLNSEGARSAEIHSYLPEAICAQRLADLKAGRLDLLVHVSLLKEGVDLPFLRWMGLRRQVNSKVYFAQHVGRVLRADEGKSLAYILDPGDLFSRHKLNLEAILEPEPVEVIAREPKERSEQGEGESDKEIVEAVSFDMHTSALRKLCIKMATQGLLSPAKTGPWRHDPASDRQIASIEKFAASYHGKRKLGAHGEVALFRELYKMRKSLTKGQASDLLDVFFSL